MTVGVLLSWLPAIDTLPVINGYDIDASLVLGVSYIRSLTDSVWIFSDLFAGFLILMSYYILMITLRFFIGKRI